MEFLLDDNRAGAGSSVLLSPEIVAIRTKLIEACDGKTFAETIEFLKQLLDKEEDEQKRLGILAARVLVLRQRVSHIQNKEDAYDISQFEALTLSDYSDSEDNEKNTGDDAETAENESWVRVRITENSIVKGVRFPKGVIVDVHNEEADALVGSGKAEVIEINEEKSDSDNGIGSNVTSEEELQRDNVDSQGNKETKDEEDAAKSLINEDASIEKEEPEGGNDTDNEDEDNTVAKEKLNSKEDK